MKPIRIFVSAAASLFVCVNASAQVTREKLAADPYAGVGIYHVYKPGNMQDTAAPEGYNPFYISHIGRHGSRYHDSSKKFDKAPEKIRKAAETGMLTERGMALYRELMKVDSATVGNLGKLSELGAEEHQMIAKRMYRRFPEVFSSEERIYVDAASSTVKRCQESMMAFTKRLKKERKSLKVNVHSGDSYMAYLLYKPADYFDIVHLGSDVTDSLAKALLDTTAFLSSIFKDPEEGAKLVSPSWKFMREVLIWGSIAPDIRLDDVCVPAYYTEDMRYQLAKVNACRIYSEMCNSVESGGRRMSLTETLLSDFIAKADAALTSGSQRAADLRFAHDVSVAPLSALIGIEGCDKRLPAKDVWKYWMTSEYVPMAMNLQMVFYRTDGDTKCKDVLVKFLLNEQERLVPALTPVEGPYYRWKDVRKFLLEKVKYAHEINVRWGVAQ